MLGVSKKSHRPTTYYALAFCIHVVAFILLCIGMFTPNWSTITEQVGTSQTEVIFDKGLIVTCDSSGSCSGNANIQNASDCYFAAFVLGIMSVILAFFILQLFAAGLCIRSCRDSNLGIPVAVMSICEGALLMLIMVLFEISIELDTTSTNIHRNDTFGFSRGLVIGAIVLYLVAAFFIIGEYMRRHNGPTPVHELEMDEKTSRRRKAPPPHSYREDYARGRSQRKQPTVQNPVVVAGGPPRPPPYSGSGKPVYYPDPEESHYSPYNGMRPCKRPGCHMCSFVAGSPTFWGPAGVFNINEKLTCQDSKVVYAIICTMDDKVFIGHSQRKLEETFRGHLESIKTRNMSDPVAVHFNLPNHSNLDMRISALARINCDSETRARLERALSYDMDRPHNSYYGVNDDFEFL